LINTDLNKETKIRLGDQGLIKRRRMELEAMGERFGDLQIARAWRLMEMRGSK
jgi:hypothetical protein